MGLSELVYEIGVTYSNLVEASGTYNLENYNVLQSVTGDDPTLNSMALTLYDAKENRAVICVEGTDMPAAQAGDIKSFLQDVSTDLNAAFVKMGVLDVHSGFKAMAMDLITPVLAFLNQYYDANKSIGEVVFCGHSLGGAVANLIAYLCSEILDKDRITIYTFGCPRFCSTRSASLFTNLLPHNFRVTMQSDVVTYLPPKLDRPGMLSGFFYDYEHCGINIQYEPTGEMTEVMGRDEQVIFTTQVYAYGVWTLLTMMYFQFFAAEASWAGSSMGVYIRNAYRRIGAMPASLRQNVPMYLEEVNNLVRTRRFSSAFQLQRIANMRETYLVNFSETHNVPLSQLRRIVYQSFVAEGGTQETFVNALEQVNLPMRLEFYQEYNALNQQIFDAVRPTTNVFLQVRDQLFPSVGSYAFYVTQMAAYSAGRLIVSGVEKIFNAVGVGAGRHGRALYRDVIDKHLGTVHHIGTATSNVLEDQYHLFTEHHYERMDVNCALPEKHGRRLSEAVCAMPQKQKAQLYHSQGTIAVPTFHKGQVMMHHLPEQYILGLYLYDPEEEFRDREDLLGFVVY